MYSPTSLRGQLLPALAALGLLFSLTVQAGSWQNNVALGGFSKVHIYTPDSLSPIGEGKSLLLLLHGCTQSIDAYKTANLETAAEAYGMVIAVPDAANKSGYSCWHYWDSTKSRSHKDYKNLISLANALSGDGARNIDANQVYIAGLSSGAAFAHTTACLAPDVFAGMGIDAGPSIGTSSNGAFSFESANVASRCQQYAGSYASHFSTQIASFAHGKSDTTVPQAYLRQNAEGMATVYGAAEGATQAQSREGFSYDHTSWTGNRVVMDHLANVTHAWPAGSGASGSYIANNGFNYALYLGEFFSQHNLRADQNEAPVIDQLDLAENAGSLAISGTAVDSDGSVASVNLVIRTATGSPVQTLNTSVDASGFFSANSNALADGLYTVTATATDNEGKDGEPVTDDQRIGPMPPATAPVLSNASASVSGQCVTVTGTVLDENQNLQGVAVSAGGQTVNASVDGTGYSAQLCNLAGGEQSATIVATDSTSLSSTASVSFTIDAGSTGDYNAHIAAGHITWGDGYSACYLAFGSNPFTMREFDRGNGQCEWVADGDASCNGPLQACSGSVSQPVDSDGDGVADNADNCPAQSNADQADNDNDGIGNVCDSTPDGVADSDGDGIADDNDNCPNSANANQADNDGDGIGNVCDSTPDGSFSCTQTTASNYAHVQAGRATSSGGYAYAVGSGSLMGLYNTFYSSTLAQTSAGYYIVGNCPK